MTNSSVFRSKEEELARLVKEIEEIRNNMKEASAALHRIERHVKRVFTIPHQANGGAAKRRVVGSAKPRPEVPTISSGEALTVFDELSTLFDDGKAEAAQGRLEQMHVPDLRLVAHELGVTFRSRPSKRTLCSAIIRRINERSMLSKNVNSTQASVD